MIYLQIFGREQGGVEGGGLPHKKLLVFDNDEKICGNRFLETIKKQIHYKTYLRDQLGSVKVEIFLNAR